jgi:opacity protein-like surface antigen
MKTGIYISIAAVALGVAFAKGASAQEINLSGSPAEGWYVRGEAGGSFSQRFGGDQTLHGKGGWTVDGAVGRSFGNGFRTDAELLYSEADAKTGQTGKMKTLAGLLNAYYDFTTGTKFQPFVGAGVGISQVKLDGQPFHGDDTGFAYQLTTGVAYPITDKLSAQIAYRYLGVNDVKVGSELARIRGDYHDQAVTVGVTYKFGS